MFFLLVYVFPLDLCLSFGIMLCINSFGFGYKVIWDEIGEVCFAQMAWEKLLRENPFLTTTATQFGRGKSA